MKLVPIETADGSITLFDTEQQVHFRSLDGAAGESQYVFVESSALAQQSEHWQVLELGFGTAMNFRKTAQAALTHKVELHYTVVEQSPLTPQKYRELIGLENELDTHILRLLEQVQTRTQVHMSLGNIHLQLFHSAWQDCQLPSELMAHAIYHDPFGPRSNPDCWTKACFEWEVAHLSPQGRLVTYAAATEARKAMVQAGLTIASLPGAGRKREMTVAAWSEANLSGCKILKNKRFYV